MHLHDHHARFVQAPSPKYVDSHEPMMFFDLPSDMEEIEAELANVFKMSFEMDSTNSNVPARPTNPHARLLERRP